MKTWITFGVLCYLTAAPPGELAAQFNPAGNMVPPYGPGADPRVRRAYRERAVAIVGPKARDFVESMGDEAVLAIFACSKPVAVKLTDFYNSGEMGKLTKPRDLLRVIAQPGAADDVAIYAIHHVRELSDIDAFDAYLMSPLDYALGLKQLEAGTAEARARRLNQAAMVPMPQAPLLPPPPPAQTENEKLAMIACFAAAIIGGLVLWRRKQQSAIY